MRMWLGALAIMLMACGGGKDTPRQDPAPPPEVEAPEAREPAAPEAAAGAEDPVGDELPGGEARDEAAAEPPTVEPAEDAQAEAAPCPPDRLVSFDPDAFKAAMDGLSWPTEREGEEEPSMAAAPDYAPLLRSLGLTEMGRHVEVASKEGVEEVFHCAAELGEARLSAGRAPDLLVRVDCQTPLAGWGALQEALTTVAILRPEGEGRFCRLGDLAFEGSGATEPCLSGRPEGARTLNVTPVSLVSPDRHALREDFYGGHCDGVMRGDDVWTRFHGVEGGHLVTYFHGVVSDASYSSPCPPSTSRTGEISLLGDWPKQIRYVERVHCHGQGDVDEDDLCGPPEPCEPAERVTTYRYADGTYTATEERPGDAPSASQLGAAGRAAVEAGDHAEAIAAFEAALALAPGDGELLGDLGWACFLADRHDDARRHTEAALAVATERPRVGALRYNLGRISEAEGDRPQAIAHYAASMRAHPTAGVRKRLADLRAE